MVHKLAGIGKFLSFLIILVFSKALFGRYVLSSIIRKFVFTVKNL